MPIRYLLRLAYDEGGATAIEYGLIAALVFIAILGGVGMVASETISMWNDVSSNASEAMSD